MVKESLDYNMLFILMATSEFDQMTQVMRCCDYLFAGGTNRRIYDRTNISYSNKPADCITLDLHIRSKDEDKSFKKFRCEISKAKSPAVPFDDILPDNL